ncbi:Gfo/Idh/MocA family protein [Sanguibacter sp. A247]|uniref:Gfo/Idh/MocA family protein n=1 Tax=unclassified Sanguibacter TaxID=2645534 RepID=UPI003FD8408A
MNAPLTHVRWGIIGVGDVTEHKSGPGFQKAERSSLVAVMRRDGAKAADYAARHGVPRWYDDADALINDPEVDAVYIATPPGSHADYAIRVAAAGKPVYVEKPMARTGEECRAMIEACDAAGVPLFVAYYRRAMPRFRVVEDLVRSGEIGEVRTVSVRNVGPRARVEPGSEAPWRLQPELSGGGLFVDLGSHALDWLDHLLGPVEEVHGIATNVTGDSAAEDHVVATFRWASGAVGTGTWAYDADEHADEIAIHGTRGSVRFPCFGEAPIRVRVDGADREIQASYPEHVQQPLIQLIVDELTGQGESPSTGRSALRTSAVIDEVLAGYRAAHA